MTEETNDYNEQRIEDEKDWIIQNLNDDKDFGDLLEKFYRQALKQIEAEIKDQYMRFASENGYSMKEAMKRVASEDVVAFSDKAREIVKQARIVEKKKGKASREDFSKYINQQLKLYNATMRINRLEMLKSKIGLEMLEAGIKVDNAIQDKLKKDYQDEIKRQSGILKVDLPPDLLKAESVMTIVYASQGNVKYSERIWANQEALINELNTQLTRMMIQGLNPRTIAKEFKKFAKKSVKNARYVSERLARTESARVQREAQEKMYKRFEIDKVQWICELNPCDLCSPYDLKVFDLDKAPSYPVHPNCRCSIAGYMED